VTIPALLLHEIFPSDGFILALLLLVCAIGVGFAFVGVFICRKYGPAALAMSTVGFCLAMFILVTSNDRDLGVAAAFPIFGGFMQALVIGYRTYDGGGRSLVVEGLIGGAVFVGSVILALIVVGIASGM
jgi:hypothetical protein